MTPRAMQMVNTASPQSTVTVRCRLVGDLRRFLPGSNGGEGPVQLPASATIDDLLERLQIPERNLLIVGVNGTKASHGSALNDGDEVTIVSPMSGGAR